MSERGSEKDEENGSAGKTETVGITATWEKEKSQKLFGNWLQKHTVGYLWDSTASGLILSTNTFLNLAMLRLATVAAGCPGNPEDDDDNCSKTIYGLKPESVLTAVATAGQLAGAVLTPFAGAISDYTSKRRIVGAISGWSLAFCTLIQAGLHEKTWFFMAVLQTVAIASYVIHQAMALSYLPGLSRLDDTGVIDDADVRYRVNSCSVVAAFGANLSSYIFFGAIFVLSGMGIVNIVNLAQGVIGLVISILYFYVWHPHNGYHGAMINVEPLKKISPSTLIDSCSGLSIIAFREIRASYILLYYDFPDVGRYLIGYAISNAAAASFATLAVVFLAQNLNFEETKTLYVIAEVLIVSLPAGAYCVKLMSRYSPKIVFLRTVGVFGATTFLGFFVILPSAADLVFFFGFVWGCCFGFYYSANTSFFTQLVPKHAESFFMSLFYFSSVILTWSPPAIFTLLNQFTNATRAVFLIMSAFFLIAYPIISSVSIPRAQLAITNHDDQLAQHPAGSLDEEDFKRIIRRHSSFGETRTLSRDAQLDVEMQQVDKNKNHGKLNSEDAAQADMAVKSTFHSSTRGHSTDEEDSEIDILDSTAQEQPR